LKVSIDSLGVPPRDASAAQLFPYELISSGPLYEIELDGLGFDGLSVHDAGPDVP
jgi:hypothetical protein